VKRPIEHWHELLNPEFKGRSAILDVPSIGIMDAAMAIASTRILIVLSPPSSFPLVATYVTRDSIAIAASMIPIDGTSRMAERPLNSGFRSSCSARSALHESGRIPSVSALYTVGIAVPTGSGPCKLLRLRVSTYWTLKGSTPVARPSARRGTRPS